MTRVRRIAAGVAVAGTLLIPFAVSSAQPAAAYCENRPVDDGGNGCSNSCKDTGNALKKVTDKLGIDLDWNCPQ